MKNPNNLQPRGKQTMLLVTIFVTGFTSLVYEIIWSRKLSLVFGANTLAVSTVLSVFMAGLAFGSLFGGKLIEKSKNTYRFLGIIEVLIGLSCLSTLFLIDNLNKAYLVLFNLVGENLVFVNLINFFLSGIILLIPTFLIGAVFPTIIKLYYTEINQVGGSVSWCYSADTIGGAMGVLISGLFLIWSLGLWKTSLLASMLNILLGIFILILFKTETTTLIKKEGEKNKDKPITDKLVLGLFFFSGMAALTLENVWIRFFDMIYGNSLVSFSLVVASFLLGLGIGSFAAKFIMRSVKNKVMLFSTIELMIGFSSLILLLIFPRIENTYLKLFNEVDSYALFNALLGGTAILFLSIPTILMGMTLPVLSTVYSKGEAIGSNIGRLYSFNSFGSILGSFLSGFVFFYFIGLNNTAIMASLMYIVIAFIFIYRYGKSNSKNFLAIFSTSLTITLLLFDFYYQPDYLYNGAYFHGTAYEQASSYFEAKEDYEILFTKQSPYSFVSVISKKRMIHIKINGRSEATTNAVTQNMLGNLPLLFHDSPQEVAIVGHGGGYSLNTVVMYPSVKSIDDIEIDKVIIEANGFIEDNGNALSDPRVNVIIADGRNYLFTNPKKYDVIISQPSHIWASSSLFTQEFFEIAKSKLNVGGIFTIWLPRFEMSDLDYAIIVNTLKSVFPHFAQFDFRLSMVFLASNHQIDIPGDFVSSHLESEEVRREMYLVRGFTGEERVDIPEFLLSHYYPNVEEYIENNVGDITLLNTDNLPILEFTTLRNSNSKFMRETSFP